MSVRTIRVGPRGWAVAGALENRSRTPLAILPRAHSPERTGFGLVATKRRTFAGLPPGASPTVATRVVPSPPSVLHPGQKWSGTFSGPQRVAPGTFLHVAFGDLGTPSARRYLYFTDHAYRVR